METVTVFTTYDDREAQIIKNLLAEYDIECQVVSTISHSVFPFTHDHRLAKINIIVTEQEAHRAEEIISGFLDSSEPSFSDETFSEADENGQEPV